MEKIKLKKEDFLSGIEKLNKIVPKQTILAENLFLNLFFQKNQIRVCSSSNSSKGIFVYKSEEELPELSVAINSSFLNKAISALKSKKKQEYFYLEVHDGMIVIRDEKEKISLSRSAYVPLIEAHKFNLKGTTRMDARAFKESISIAMISSAQSLSSQDGIYFINEGEKTWVAGFNGFSFSCSCLKEKIPFENNFLVGMEQMKEIISILESKEMGICVEENSISVFSGNVAIKTTKLSHTLPIGIDYFDLKNVEKVNFGDFSDAINTLYTVYGDENKICNFCSNDGEFVLSIATEEEAKVKIENPFSHEFSVNLQMQQLNNYLKKISNLDVGIVDGETVCIFKSSGEEGDSFMGVMPCS